MRWRVALGAALVLLTVPASGFGWFRSPSVRASYYSAPVVYCYPVAPVVAVAPPFVPAPPPRLYAEPQPAPPSGTPEPPKAPPGDLMPKAGVNERESKKTPEPFFDAYFVAGAKPVAADRCAVMFWNQTGRALTLTVDGQSRSLPAGQSVRLDLKRDFAWGVAGRGEERRQVPAQEAGLDIVIRR
jgi:hypothetical protein